MKDWSKRITLSEMLRRAETWPGEAYFDGDQHRLVLRRNTRQSIEQLVTQLARLTQRTSMSILESVRESSESEIRV